MSGIPKYSTLLRLTLVLFGLVFAASVSFFQYTRVAVQLKPQTARIRPLNRATLIQIDCHDLVIPFDPECPRVLSYSITRAGFGHQFSELLFGLKKARVYGLAYMFEPFVGSDVHQENYTIVNDLLGLTDLFPALGAPSRSGVDEVMLTSGLTWKQLEHSATVNRSSVDCGSYLNIGGYTHCGTDCFRSPDNAHLFQDVAKCFRSATRQLGSAFDRCIFLDRESTRDRLSGRTVQWLATDTIVTVWHVRLGDFTPHQPEDMFYQSVLKELKEITQGYKLFVLLVGKGRMHADGTSEVSPDYVEKIQTRASEVWKNGKQEEAVEILAPRYNFSDAFIAMMQADVLVGSGSSLPAVASLVSGVPLFFNHVPKHGYNVGFEMTADSVDMEANGTVLESRRRLRTEIYARMHPKIPTVCRRHSLHALF
jgi:hypothetical protein